MTDFAGLHGHRWDDFERALVQAAESGPAGDRALADVLPAVGRERKVLIAATLGDLRGPAGTAALRSAMRESGASEDLRCAALLALAKREGPAASPDLLDGLASRNGHVKDYAVFGFAAVGDGSGWEAVFTRLRQLLARDRPRAVDLSEVVTALCYLGSRLGPDPGRRVVRLVGLLRARWHRLTLDEQVWLGRHWTAATPEGPVPREVPAPDRDRLIQLIRGHPLFARLDA